MNSQPHINVRDLKVGAFVDGIYSLVNPQTAVTRGGKCYFKALIRDATGEAAARKWTFEESNLQDVSATGYARVVGRVELYNGQNQIVLEQIQGVEVSAEDLVSLLP
ncbi:MAG: hypothetical protein NTY97_02100, partial [Planctomycetota bacterium]|nr:hypothetical protein [Planctomycetota bacterium]